MREQIMLGVAGIPVSEIAGVIADSLKPIVVEDGIHNVECCSIPDCTICKEIARENGK